MSTGTIILKSIGYHGLQRIEEDLTQPRTLFVTNIGETNLSSCQYTMQELVVTDISLALIPSTP